MNFFDYIKNESFFKPLTFKYRRIYYDCIRILIDRSKELPVLYESGCKGQYHAVSEKRRDSATDRRSG